MVVVEQSGCIRKKVVVFGQKWFSSGKSGCIRARCLYLGKSRCVWAKVHVIEQKCLYSEKVVVFRQIGSIRAKVVVFG